MILSGPLFHYKTLWLCSLDKQASPSPLCIFMICIDYWSGINGIVIKRWLTIKKRAERKEGRLQKTFVRTKSGKVKEKMLPQLALISLLGLTWTTGLFDVYLTLPVLHYFVSSLLSITFINCSRVKHLVNDHNFPGWSWMWFWAKRKDNMLEQIRKNIHHAQL